MSKRARVLVVDDSALMRKLIPQILADEPGIEVVGTAMDGAFALQKIDELKPNVVTLDLEMPRMDGMETLRHITRRHRLPVIMLSAHTADGAAATFKALSLGAFDFVPKPRATTGHELQEIACDLIRKIRVAVNTELPQSRTIPLPPPERTAKPASRFEGPATKVIAIGISTGGPNALQELLPQLPGDFPAAIVIVQHMPQGFTEMFARRLNECCAIDVAEAKSGDLLLPGRALICPGDRHLRVRRMPLGDVVVLSNEEERVNGHRPSADVLFRSVAAEFAGRGIGLIMTGMGEDGADGLGAIRAAGGLTIAQDAATSVVFGMPKIAIERGHAMRVLPLHAIANTLIAQAAPLAARAKKETAKV